MAKQVFGLRTDIMIIEPCAGRRYALATVLLIPQALAEVSHSVLAALHDIYLLLTSVSAIRSNIFGESTRKGKIGPQSSLSIRWRTRRI